MLYINARYGKTVETVDSFETRKESNEMLAEYQMSDPYNQYWVSSRATMASRNETPESEE